MDLQQKIESQEKRIAALEEQMAKILKEPNISLQNAEDSFVFSNKKREHNELLEELLKSDFCHVKNGLSFDQIIGIFKTNGRPVDSKKVKDLLGIWKSRKKIEAVKTQDSLRYFWITNE